MNWYYVEAGQQAGPLDDAQIAELERRGKIQSDTLVWHEGMTDWQPYHYVKPGAPVVPPPAAGPATASALVAASGGVMCSECGKSFSADEVIRYGDRFICATCKPIFFQRLQEGAPLSGRTPQGTATEAEILARDYEVDVGASLTRGWEVFKSQPGVIIGASILVYLVLMAINLVPYLSIILALVLSGPLMGGLWVFYVKNVRGQPAGVSDAFSGFGPRFWQLAMTQLVPGLVSFAFMMLFGIVAALTIPAMASARRGAAGNLSSHFAGMAVPMGILLFLFALVMIYLTTSWVFALPLAGDKGLKFWPALELSRRIVKKHWWMTFWLIVVCSILGAVGILACFLGVLVTGPVAFATLASHYEKVFGDLAPTQG
jgi:hypothetical protein